MVGELQAVILAAGEGSKMYPLTEDLPKCLLPIANMPMIWYVVSYLERSGFQDFIVVVRSTYASLIQQTLQSLCNSSSKFDMLKLEEEESLGTVDALRSLRNKIKTDLLVASCDMITDAPLHRLIDIHRIYDASITVMLSKHIELQLEKDITSKSKQKQHSQNTGNRDIVSVDSLENRLLFFANEGDIESDCITFKKSMLNRYPKIKLLTNLVDSHLYVMKKWLLDYITDNSKFENIKSDAIPLIVRKQFSKQRKDVAKINSTFLEDSVLIEEKKDIYSYLPDNDMQSYMKEYSCYQGDSLKDNLKCHAYVNDSFCLRVNTLPSYVHINRQLTKLKEEIAPSLELNRMHPSVVLNGKTQIGNDCLVGESTVCSNNVTIKKSIVGKHCTIGPDVRITNCIIMNHVTITNGCNLQGSILCDNAYIQANCTMVNCQVSAGQTVKENSNLKNESIVVEEMGFEE